MKYLIAIALLLSFTAYSSYNTKDVNKNSSKKITGKLILTGSSTVAPLVLEIAKRFEKQNPAVRIDVQTGGSTRGVVDVLQGVSNIGMASRALKNAEKNLIPYTIANDGIAVILHKSNPISSLTKEQLISIFTGKVTNWKEVGGKNLDITIVNKAEGRSTLELFLKYFNLKSQQVKPHIIIGDNEQGIKTISGNPSAIGYVSVGTAEYSAKNDISIKLLPMNGIIASVENIAKGNFPLSRPLNLIISSTKNPLAEKFINFSQSKEVHDLIKQQYFVPIKR